ncbi:MAG: ParA family protein [Chromatiales bacterium]|nr:ParA family protein [Chromatiales bacterium]
MSVFALVGNKGGTGKTTLGINIAHCLAETGATVLLDADPQGSSLQWCAIGGDTLDLVVEDAGKEIGSTISDRRNRFRHVIVDCPPSVHSRATRQALECCDLALIPVQPSPLDLWASVHIERELDRARRHNADLQALLVINQLEPRTQLSRLTREALSELSLPAAETAIRRRVAYRNAVLRGRSVLNLGSQGAAAAEEIRQLVRELVNRL